MRYIVRKMTDGQMCSKCGVRSRAYPETGNPWCLQCLAEYRKRYDRGIRDRLIERGFMRGRDNSRELLVAEFRQMGSAQFTAAEVAEIIKRRLERP